MKVGVSHRYCEHKKGYRQDATVFEKWEGGDKGVSQETCQTRGSETSDEKQ